MYLGCEPFLKQLFVDSKIANKIIRVRISYSVESRSLPTWKHHIFLKFMQDVFSIGFAHFCLKTVQEAPAFFDKVHLKSNTRYSVYKL